MVERPEPSETMTGPQQQQSAPQDVHTAPTFLSRYGLLCFGLFPGSRPLAVTGSHTRLFVWTFLLLICILNAELHISGTGSWRLNYTQPPHACHYRPAADRNPPGCSRSHSHCFALVLVVASLNSPPPLLLLSSSPGSFFSFKRPEQYLGESSRSFNLTTNRGVLATEWRKFSLTLPSLVS